MIVRLRIAVIAGLLALCAPGAMADQFTPAQRDEIGAVIREYLLNNPEILLDVSRELDKRQQEMEARQREGAVLANAKELYHSPEDLVAGDVNGDVTMVEFFDYNCAWCKKGLPEVLSLLDRDKKLRLIMKEFPIFGADSEYAARAALASKAQGKYWPFHLAMLGHQGHVTAALVDQIAGEQGLDLAKLKMDMDSPAIQAVIDRNQKLAQSLAINGTPAFIIANKVIPGYLPADQLAQSPAFRKASLTAPDTL
jgi:protein-disulfide isomerase